MVRYEVLDKVILDHFVEQVGNNVAALTAGINQATEDCAAGLGLSWEYSAANSVESCRLRGRGTLPELPKRDGS